MKFPFFSQYNKQPLDLKLMEYTITWEPLGKFNDDIQDDLGLAYDLAHKKNSNILPKLLKYVEKYPKIPQFYNYVAAHYDLIGKREKGYEMTKLISAKFPDYLMGKINLCLSFIHFDNEPEKVLSLFPDAIFDVKYSEPQRRVFHISEVSAMARLAVRYFCAVKDFDKAEDYYDNLKKILPKEKDILNDLSDWISRHRMIYSLTKLKENHEKLRKPKDFPTAIYEPTTIPPQFFHFEIANLYKYSDENIPHNILEEITNLPRITLIEDLIKVIEDGIKRYKWFYETYEKWNPDEQSFLVHALRLLGALEANEALTAILNLFRQGDAFLDYWFADWLFDFSEDIYQIIQFDLEATKNFMLERNVTNYGKTVVSNALAQIPIHQPHRKKDVIDVYRAVLQNFIDNENDADLIDTSLGGSIVADINDFKGIELIDIIEEAFSKKLIDEQVMGNFEQVKKEFNRPFDPHDKLPIAPDIVERYIGDYLKNRPNPIFNEEEKALSERILNSDILKKSLGLFSREKDNDMDDEDEEFDDYEDVSHAWKPQLPIKNQEQKVGRNDPCPCGSGKKYKKCHGS